MFAFVVFAISIAFLVTIMLVKGYDIKQAHWLFLAFMLLYNVFPFLYLRGYHPDWVSFGYSLIDSEAISDVRLYISAACVVTYGLLLSLSNHHADFASPAVVSLWRPSFRPFVLFLAIYPFAMYFSYNYRWQDIPVIGAQPGHSVAAHLKNLLLVIFVFIAVGKSRSRTRIALVLYILLAQVDTQRTNLFIVGIVYLLTGSSRRRMRTVLSALGFVTVILLLGLTRLGMDYGRLLYPIYTEAIYGSYCVSQAIEVVNNAGAYSAASPTILAPLIDVAVKVTPATVIQTVIGREKQDQYVFETFMNAMHENGTLAEQYMPMGGAFFTAEYHILLPYLGPIVFVAIFVYYLGCVARLRDGYLRVICYSTSFVLLKATSLNAIKFILVLVACYYGLRAFDWLVRGLKSTVGNVRPQTR